MRLVLALSITVCPVLTTAQPVCATLEYAQYKDRAARDRSSRLLVAFNHCEAKAKEKFWLGSPSKQAACRAEAEKAIDALRAAGDKDVIAFAERTCTAPVPAHN